MSPPSRQSSHPHRLRVLTYNIHKGFNLGNGSHVLERIRAAVRRVDPDMIFLQEILGEHTKHRELIPDWPEDSQLEFLAEGLWPHHAYGKNAVYAHGHHGNAVLSKFPITQWENVDISSNRLEQRGILHGMVQLPESSVPLHFFCLHLNLFERGRRPQVQALCKRINALVPAECPLIIGGDFNDWRGRATATLEQQTGVRDAFQALKNPDTHSFPSVLPMLTLDHFYFRGATIAKAAVLDGKPWNSLSDHLPLLCEFSV